MRHFLSLPLESIACITVAAGQNRVPEFNTELFELLL